MRHPFTLAAWFDHCGGYKHPDAVANIEAEAEKPHLKTKKQKAMVNFFPVTKKKKKEQTALESNGPPVIRPSPEATDGEVNARDIANAVDLTAEEQTV